MIIIPTYGANYLNNEFLNFRMKRIIVLFLFLFFKHCFLEIKVSVEKKTVKQKGISGFISTFFFPLKTSDSCSGWVKKINEVLRNENLINPVYKPVAHCIWNAVCSFCLPASKQDVTQRRAE